MKTVFVLLWFSLGQFSSAAEIEPETQAASWDRLVERAQAEYGQFGRRAAEFLRDHRPERDADLDEQLLWENLEYALKARSEFPWAREVPEELYLNDVLPYAVFDETRENWRPGMYERCREIVKECATATEAIQALNREYFKAINVHYNTGRKAPNQSPSESVAQGRATCTGLSIILVDACRSVGIPARAAGVASWHDKRGNHTWVEAWDGQWHFTGADEYNASGLDRAWFTGDASKAVAGDQTFAVWATSWKATGNHFPMVWNQDATDVPAVDVTHRYRHDTPKPSADAVVHLRVWDGENRIAAEVRAVNTRGKVAAAVQTRAGTTDLNDMPSITLKPEASYTIAIEHEGRVFVTPMEIDSSGETTIDLKLAECESALNEQEAEAAIESAWKGVAAKLAKEKAERPKNTFEWNGHTMPILEKVFGEEPETGHSLWISMHGGGGAPKEVNDQQWHNQIRLYEPTEGIYIAPRAPTNTWNLWHQAHIDPLFDQLIATYVATRHVNPDRVYLMGYSAGGDGVYQLAPRMADRFAAAAMMAGHPNESQPLGLRNLPFAIFMGGKDGAYNRNKIAETYGEKLDALRKADPEGYTHHVTIYPDYAHWMNGEDREALPWMAKFSRNVWPKKVVWHQDDVTHTRFYWLGVSPEDAAGGRDVTATAEGQTIHIETSDLSSLILYLRDGLIDLSKPITVTANGQVAFEGRVYRTESAISSSLSQRQDPRAAAASVLRVSWQADQSKSISGRGRR